MTAGLILATLIIVIGVAAIGSVVNLLHIDSRVDPIVGKISFRESMDLLDLPVITLVNNGKKLNFLLDTGASHSSINIDSVEGLLGEKLDEQSFYIGVEGTRLPAQWMQAPVCYKEREYIEKFQVIDLNAPFSELKTEYGVNLQGILGNTFFQKYKYILDFNDLVAYPIK